MNYINISGLSNICKIEHFNLKRSYVIIHFKKDVNFMISIISWCFDIHAEYILSIQSLRFLAMQLENVVTYSSLIFLLTWYIQLHMSLWVNNDIFFYSSVLMNIAQLLFVMNSSICNLYQLASVHQILALIFQFYMARKSFTFNTCLILLFQLDVPIEFPFPHIKSTSK